MIFKLFRNQLKLIGYYHQDVWWRDFDKNLLEE